MKAVMKILFSRKATAISAIFIVLLILVGLAILAALRYIRKHGASCGGSCTACSADCPRRRKDGK